MGSSRGGFDLDKIVDFLQDKKVSQLFVIGGDGTHRGAFVIHEGCMARGLNVAVAGIPKTIGGCGQIAALRRDKIHQH